MERIIELIREEQGRGLASTRAEVLRWAAWYVREELPTTTAAEFGDAAAAIGIHRGSAMNRWREAMKNWDIAHG